MNQDPDLITRATEIAKAPHAYANSVVSNLIGELLAEVERLNLWREQERQKILRQRKAFTDLAQHCKRIEAERDGLARKVAAIQRSGDDLAHSELADLQERVYRQRLEIARLRAKEAREGA